MTRASTASGHPQEAAVCKFMSGKDMVLTSWELGRRAVRR